MGEASQPAGFFTRLLGLAGLGTLLLFVFAGSGVAAGLASLFKFGSTAFWVGIGAFAVFFIATR